LSKYNKKYYEYNKTSILLKSKIYRDKNRIDIRKKGRIIDEKRKYEKELYRNTKKLVVFRHYCGKYIKCQCCGFDIIHLLTIDHIRGRKQYNHKKNFGGYGLYLWIIKNKFPKHFRVLCFNCNFSAGKNNNIKNECIHKYRRDIENTIRIKTKTKVLNHYTKNNIECSKCGEKEIDFMTMEHINGGGNKHRIKLNGINLYDWLIKNNYPDGFDVLCVNCNQNNKYILGNLN